MEFDEIVVKESPGLCRCCLSEGCYKDLGSEYTWMNETEVYADMLLECFDISITQHNEGPNGPNRLICEVCITRLRDACNFKKQVMDSEKKFIDMMGRGEFRPKMLIYQTQMKNEDPTAAEDSVEDADIEYLEDEIDFGDDDLKDELAQPSVSDPGPVELPVKSKRGRPRKNTPVKPEKRAKVAKLDDKAKTSKAVAKDLETEVRKQSACYLRRRNLKILFNNTTLIPFKWRGKYLCFYCGDDMKTPDIVRKHTKGHGPCSIGDRALQLVKSAVDEIKIDVSDVTCEICSESFLFLDEIIDHLIFKHQLPYKKDIDMLLSAYSLMDLQCLLCDKRFDFLSKLISHMNTAHPNNSFECPECKKTFNRKREVDAHLKYNHKKYHSCNKCDETFSTVYALKIHRSNAHSLTCNICFQVFSSDGKRSAHLKSDHDIELAQCGFCDKVLTTKRAFITHAANCEYKPKDKTVVIDDGDKEISIKEIRKSLAAIFNMTTALPFKFFMNRFRCFYCTRDFTSCKDLKEHSLSAHPYCDTSFKAMTLRNRYDGFHIKVDTSSLSCRHCHIALQDLNNLIDHLTKEHKVKCDMTIQRYLQPFKLIKDNYPCPICGEVNRYFGILLKHVSVSHSGNKHICMYCGKAFRTDPNLRAHASRCNKTFDKYKCTSCGLQFPTNSALGNHQRTVHGTKLYQCFKCSEKFISEYSMQRHLITSHGTGHKCTYCGKLFTKNSFMVNHVRRFHLEEKNLECTVCSEKFFDNQNLNRHMVKHVGERNFHCDICGKKFLWKNNLKCHMVSHIRNANARNVT